MSIWLSEIGGSFHNPPPPKTFSMKTAITVFEKHWKILNILRYLLPKAKVIGYVQENVLTVFTRAIFGYDVIRNEVFNYNIFLKIQN
jgi:hypothetical protein